MLGGTSDTDELLSSFLRVPESARLKLYYRLETMGSLFVNALGTNTDLAVEALQDSFTKVNRHLQKLTCSWDISNEDNRRTRGTVVDRDNRTIWAMYQWPLLNDEASSVVKRLASVHFPTCAGEFAACYEGIATQRLLKDVLKRYMNDLDCIDNQGELEAIARFRVITASINVSVLSRLTNTGFKGMSHMTEMDLNTYTWLDKIASTLDKSLRHGIPFYDAVKLLSIIHAGAPYETLEIDTAERSMILGYRQGIFATMPSLFRTLMRAGGDDQLGLACFETFIGNVPVFPDGTVRAGGENTVRAPVLYESTRMPATDWQRLSEITATKADSQVYVGLERPLLSVSPTVVFSIRMRGSVVGTASIRRVLYAITRSWNRLKMCDGHPGGLTVRAVEFTTQMWSMLGQERLERVNSEMQMAHPLHIPMLQNSGWVFYVAGCSAEAQVAISFGCSSCAQSLLKFPAHNPAIICGYGSVTQSSHDDAMSVGNGTAQYDKDLGPGKELVVTQREKE